jgi:hypothetical protein
MVAWREDVKVFPLWSTHVEIVILNGLRAGPSAKRFAAQQDRKSRRDYRFAVHLHL